MLKIYVKKAISIILIGAIISVSAILLFLYTTEPQAALAANNPTSPKTTTGGGFDVYIDSENNVCIVTNDKKKTSNIYYKTIGFTISRGKFNPSEKKLANGASTEYFMKVVNFSSTETTVIGGREINIFKYPFTELKAQIAGTSGEWAQEIEDALYHGATAYIRFDCLMWIYHGSVRTGHTYRNDPTVGPYDDENLDLNPNEIQHAEPWSAGANTGLRSHYHRWLPISSGAPIKITKPWKDHHVTSPGGQPEDPGVPGPGPAEGGTLQYYGDYSGAPAFAGGNANLEGYNAGAGIPSTKTVTGYAEASPWHGSADVWARMVTKQFNLRTLYRWEPVPYTMWEGEDSKDRAIKELEDKEEEDKHEIKELLDNDGHMVGEKPHDTPLEHVYHHWIRVTYKDDAGTELLEDSEWVTNALPEIGHENPDDPADGAKGTTIPESSDTQYDPEDPGTTRWCYGYTTKKFKGYDAGGEAIYETVEDAEWSSVTEAHRPNNSDYDEIEYHWKDGKVKKTEFKLTSIVDREYWDEKYKGTEDGFIQVYAAFEYLDPYRSKFYDLNSVTLYNDTYGSMSFPQTVDTYMDSGKADIRNAQYTDFLAWMQQPNSGGNRGETQIEPATIVTNDYLIWSKQKSDKFEKLDKKYEKDAKRMETNIYSQTKTMNDYVQVKNAVDKGPATGIYLGNKDAIWNHNVRTAGAGIVTGCDFRDGKWMSFDNLGEKSELIGTDYLLKEEQNEKDGYIDLGKYWYLCKHSAGANSAANAYLGTETSYVSKLSGVNQAWEELGYQTSGIKEDIRNGSHKSDISTLYTHEIIGYAVSSTTMQFDSVASGHLYSDVIGTSGTDLHPGVTDSKWGGKMGSEEGGMEGGYHEGSGVWVNKLDGPGTEANVNPNEPGDASYIVDPVQIHTPIMSPGDVEDGGGSTITDPTNLVDDPSGEDTSQLRNDQYYYIRWMDLSELGKKHREDAATPGTEEGSAGGYWDETEWNKPGKDDGLEEDEYTKNKYMKFPFEVMYDGKFWKANQWILIKNPNKYNAAGNAEDNDNGYLRNANHAVLTDGSFKSENHWVYTPFYIPTWAKEGLYEGIESHDPDHPVDLTTCAQLKVDAINVTEKDKDGNVIRNSADQIQELANTYYNIFIHRYNDGAAYVATFNLPVQLSGWIYGFTITGTSDSDIFGQKSIGEITTSQVTQDYDYSFAAHKQDKKSGLKNRLGFPALRYLADGSTPSSGGTASPWDIINTVALVGAWKDNTNNIHYGKSNYWKYMGTVPKGNTFSFTLKTIANMWNFNDGDYISIKPTFAYQKYDRTTGSWTYKNNENLKVYYTDRNNYYIPYGTDRDRVNLQDVSLGNRQFDQSYYTEEDAVTVSGKQKTFADWINYNTYTYDKRRKLLADSGMTFAEFKTALQNDASIIGAKAITAQQWLARKISSFCLSNIRIPEGLRLFSGEADQLKINNFGNSLTTVPIDATKSNFKTYRDLVGSNYGKEFESIFDGDNNLGVTSKKPTIAYNYIDGNTNTEYSVTAEPISMDDKFRYSIQSWYGKYYIPSDLYVVDLSEHPEFRDFSDPASPYHGMVNADGSVTMPDGRKYWDYMEYYATEDYKNNDGLTDDEDIFIQDGFLNINFYILAYKNKQPHLVYKGNYGNQWKTENYPNIPENIETLDDPLYPGNIAPPEDGKTEDGVPTQYGDVVVVDLSKKYSDRFRAGIYNVN